MDLLNFILPVLLYIAGIILLIVLIILGIRLIQMLNKIDRVVDNIEGKVNSLNIAFDLVTKVSDSLSMVGETMIGLIASGVSKIFNRKNHNEEDLYE